MIAQLGEQEWQEIRDAVQMFSRRSSFKQVKGEGWTVYKTASCVRIDINTIENSPTEEEPVHA